MHPPIDTTQAPASQTYRVSVKSHLSSDWLAMPGVVALTMGHDPAGWPMTTLLLKVADRAQMLGVLHEMHDLNLALLSVELVRHPSPSQTEALPLRQTPQNGVADYHG